MATVGNAVVTLTWSAPRGRNQLFFERSTPVAGPTRLLPAM